jgi:hypothetical protein
LKVQKPAIRAQKERERAWKLVPKFDNSEMVNNLVKQTKGKTLEGIMVKMMAAMSSDYAKRLRDITFKTRWPLRPIPMGTSFIQEIGNPYCDEDRLRLGLDTIPLHSLPPVDSFFVSTEEDVGLSPRCMITTDIVLMYYSMLDIGQLPKQIYGSMESVSLQVLLPFVAGSEKVECVLDIWSQIVSIAKTLAECLGVVWDPDVHIYMQSANRQLKESEGLAHNVRFTFGDMTIHLQVHVIDQPVYQVLLGRPFDILTESIV